MVEVEKVENAVIENVKSFAAGGFGGICAVLTGHPFDLVKVRLQTGMYNSAVQCVKETVAKDGLVGLYRGVSAPLLGVTPMFAVSFWGYDVGKRLVGNVTGKTADQFEIKHISTAGFISAIPTTLVAAPFERVKVVMQIQEGKGSNSMAATVAKMYKEGGLKSVFKGSVLTLARDGPGSAIYFATYEVIKKKLSKPGEDLSLLAISTAGGFAGVSMWLTIFPIDTIKSTQQSSTHAMTITEATKTIWAKGGVKAFFPGVGPALLRSFPANAATFVGVELARDFLNKVV